MHNAPHTIEVKSLKRFRHKAHFGATLALYRLCVSFQVGTALLWNGPRKGSEKREVRFHAKSFGSLDGGVSDVNVCRWKSRERSGPCCSPRPIPGSRSIPTTIPTARRRLSVLRARPAGQLTSAHRAVSRSTARTGADCLDVPGPDSGCCRLGSPLWRQQFRHRPAILGRQREGRGPLSHGPFHDERPTRLDYGARTSVRKSIRGRDGLCATSPKPSACRRQSRLDPAAASDR